MAKAHDGPDERTIVDGRHDIGDGGHQPPLIDDPLRWELFRATARRQRAGCEELLAWLEEHRRAAQLRSEKVGLSEAMKARFGDPSVTDGRLEDQIALLKITLHEREVKTWCQPLMFDRTEQLCGLVIRRAATGFEALVQAVEEPGIVDSVQLGPTVQTDVSRSRPDPPEQGYRASFERRLERQQILFDVVLSEEGGRFFRDQRRYAAVLSEDGHPHTPAENWRWASLSDLKQAIETPNVVNIFARTALAILLY